MKERGLHIVSGGGPVGLIVALLLSERYPPERILLLEQSEHFGGLYNGFDYGAVGVFDNGMHVLYETGIPEIDLMLRNLLPEHEWNVLEGSAKDVAGVYWNGNLQTHSPYIDLRRLPASERDACAHAFFALDLAHADDLTLTAQQYARERFGEPIAGHVIACLEKLYQRPAAELSALAMKMPAMDRVILFDAPAMEEYMHSEPLRARLAYPDQLALPAFIPRKKQAALYPKEFGMGRVIDQMVRELEKRGVLLKTRSRVTSIHKEGAQVKTLRASLQGEEKVFDDVVGLYWTSGLPQLGAMLGLPVTEALSAPLPTSLHINLRLDRPPQMGPLYHFYCFDEGFHTFRVTNYSNYCPGAPNHLGYPVCVELWPEYDGQIEDPVAAALRELKAFGVIDTHKTTFSDVQPCRRIHDSLSLERVVAMRALRYDIEKAGIHNLMWSGVMAEENMLLLYEILRDAHAKIERMRK